MPSIKDLKFDMGDKVKIKCNGLIGNIAGIYMDGLGVSLKVGFKIFRKDLIDDYGTYFHQEELERLGE